MFTADAIEGSMRDLDIALTITRKSLLSNNTLALNAYDEVSVEACFIAAE